MRNLIVIGLMVIGNSWLSGQNAVSVNSVRLTASFDHVSCHVNITGDDNINSNLQIEYKIQGNSEYKTGAQSMRATPNMIIDGSILAMNFHAGSAMFLQPNAAYDIRMILTDSDGGTQTIDRIIKTKAYPALPSIYTPINVSAADGPDGIQDAVNTASPGDIIEVENGVYNPFEILTDSVIIRSVNLHGAIIEGGNTDRGVVTIGTFDDSIRYVLIDGLNIRNGKWGIDAQNTQFITVQNCDITDVDYGFLNRRANGWEHDQFITNNRFVGRTVWPQSNGNIPGERGVDIRGNNNVISFNTITDFGDGVTTDGPPYRISYGLDIHHNDISRIVDDLIEVDGMISNSRVYSNRAWNGRAGVSLAPVFGGPAYVFRNEFVNMENSTYKMNRSPAGLYIAHNTTVQSGDGMTSPAGWQSTVMKNNLVYSGNYCFQEYGLVSGSADDWDYNGYFSTRAGTSGSPWFKWDNIRYNLLPALFTSTGIEENGVQVNLSDLVNVSLPSDPFTESVYTSFDLNVAEASNAKDTGVMLANINLPYVFDGAPDLGAREKGVPVFYGHNFVDFCGQSDLSMMTWNGAISQSWNDPRNWTPCGIPDAGSQVIIPEGLMRYPLVEGQVKSKMVEVGN